MLTTKQSVNPAYLTNDEIGAIVGELCRKNRSRNTRQNLILFRLAVHCGLRPSEIVGLNLRHVRTVESEPRICVPPTIAAKHGARIIPLTWDADTLADLAKWKIEREKAGAGRSDPFLCSWTMAKLGNRLSIRTAQLRW